MSDSCQQFEPELSSLLDGELSPQAEAAVRRHLDGCDACRAAVERLRGVSAVLRRWDAQETRYATSNAFRNRVLARVGASAAPQSARAGDFGQFVRFAAAAVVVLAAGAAGALLTASRSGSTETEFARLESQLEELRERVRATASPAAVPLAGAPTVDVDPVDPLEPWDPVVSSIEDTSASGVGEPRPDGRAPEFWEEHGDQRITREAFEDYDRFQRDRNDLTLREAVRRLEERDAATAASRPTTDAAPGSPVAAFFGTLRPADGPFSPYEQVQVWPIERDGASARSDGLLGAADALRSDVLTVTEGATRESVHVKNRDAGRTVLILAGDVFYGGRQDRVAAEDVLLSPGQGRSVRTVKSGEARRTHRRTFQRADGMAPAGVRGLVAQGAGQRVLDDAVRARVTLLASAGRYGSLDNLFANDQLQNRAGQYAEAFAARLDRPNVVGFAVAAGSELLGVEVFGDRATFETMGGRVLRSYVLEALSRMRLEGVPPGRERVVAALRAVRGAAFSPGADDVTAFLDMDGGVLGHGLTDPHGVVHAVVFTAATSGPDATAAKRGRPDGSPGLTGPDLRDGERPPGPERGATGGGGLEPSER